MSVSNTDNICAALVLPDLMVLRPCVSMQQCGCCSASHLFFNAHVHSSPSMRLPSFKSKGLQRIYFYDPALLAVVLNRRKSNWWTDPLLPVGFHCAQHLRFSISFFIVFSYFLPPPLTSCCLLTLSGVIRNTTGKHFTVVWVWVLGNGNRNSLDLQLTVS